LGDIGTHAAQLAEYISGLITQLCADINIVVEGRKLDDDGNVLLKFNNGANGILVASQIACGEENSLKLRFTEKRRLEWHQMEPNYWLNGLVVPVKSIEPIVIYQIVPSLILTPQDIQKDT
jgi:predicted dehydrogenase